METFFLILAVISASIVLMMDRIYHGIIYDGGQLRHPFIRWWREATFLKVKSIHKPGDILYGGVSLAIFCALMAGQGLSLKTALGAALISTAPFWIISPFGQAVVNIGSGLKADPGLWRKAKPLFGIAAVVVGVHLL